MTRQKDWVKKSLIPAAVLQTMRMKGRVRAIARTHEGIIGIFNAHFRSKLRPRGS